MRQSKICTNHLIITGTTVQEHAGNEKSCVWYATDFADGELKDEMFCICFASIDNCKNFMEMFQEVVESQKKLEENSDATQTAEALEKLSVGEDKSKEKTSEESTPPTETAAPAEVKETEPKKDYVEKDEDSSA